MNEPLDVRDNAWIDAFAVFRKANLYAWAVYNNAIAEADAKVAHGKVWAYAYATFYDKYGRAPYSWELDRENIFSAARAILEKARTEAYAKANAVRENAVAAARAILEKARADADVVYEKVLAEAEKINGT